MNEDSRNLSGTLFHRSLFKDGCGALARRRVPN